MKKPAEKHYLVTMRVVVSAKTDKKALAKMNRAVDQAMKVAVDVEEAPDE